MQDDVTSPAAVGGPLDEKVQRAVDDYLRTHESRLYDAIRGEVLKQLPDPMQPLREVIDATRATLAEYGITASSEEVAAKLALVLPQEIVQPLVDVHALIAPRLEWAMGQILDNAQIAVDKLRDAVMAPIDARLREIFHTVFIAVTRKAAELLGRVVGAALQKLIDALVPLIQRLVATLIAAVAVAIAMAIQAMLELVNAVGRMALKMAKALAMWIARKIAMFVTKMVWKLFCFLFGVPDSQMEITWMETSAMLRV